VADVLILADSTRSPEMRHEVPVAIPDSFLYAERDGRRVVVVSSLEAKRIAEADPGLEVIPLESLGVDELLASGASRSDVDLQIYTRACKELGIASASVPPTFPLELADRLRENGIEVRVDREQFDDRRRRKSATEIAGLRRAQRACEAALDVAREMLRNATINGTLVLDGAEPPLEPDAGVLVRSVKEGPPVSVTYTLTDAGEALLPALEEIGRWADLHLPVAGSSPRS